MADSGTNLWVPNALLFYSSEYIHFNGIDPKILEIIEMTNEGHAAIQYCNLKGFILIQSKVMG